jgi:cytochrome c
MPRSFHAGSAGLLLALAAVAGAAADQPAGDPAAGQAAFRECKACHSVAPGKLLVGPPLFGVVGRKAGTIDGFAYSDGLKASGITWNDTTIDTWISNPKQVIAGTKMLFLGEADAKKRADIIAYLKTLQ